MNIIKQAGGNVVLTDSAGNILKSFINVNALDIVSDNEIIIKFGYNQWHSIFASVLQFTQVEPAAAVAWSGDAYALAALLSLDFFYVASGPCPPCPPCPPNLTTAKLMKTGQTTSFRTGDDGDLEVGRDVDFLTLAENNPFGTTNRFTDELGGQTYTLNIVIDWSTYDGTTVLGYNKIENGVNINWTNAIDAALAESIGTFTSGWRLPNIIEIINICNWRLAAVRYLGYSPFGGAGGLVNAVTFWSSTTSANNVGTAITFVNNTAVIASTGKNSSISMRYFAVRYFTVTGTILT